MDRDILILNCELLDQGIHLLAAVDRSVYARPVAEADSDGVGAHLRHCVDFYEAFLRGLDAGNLDYDDRTREPALELDIDVARARLEDLKTRLMALTARTPPHTVSVRHDAVDERGGRPASLSSVDRELQFLAAHTVHHFALIRVLLKLQDVGVPDEFGVAPSTLRFWKARAR